MNDLFRELAPISTEAWAEIDKQAKQTLERMLAARKLVDVSGPHGWAMSAVSSGRVERVKGERGGIEAHLRAVQPLVEARVPFELSRRELESIGRGAKNFDLQPVNAAAQTLATSEDAAIFHGYAAARIEGITEAAAEATLTLSDDYEKYPGVVAEATGRLRAAGVDGPYAIALGPRCFTGLTRTAREGYPVIEHVRRLVNGPIVWAPGVDGAVVLSQRGGDFELTLGQDISIGYLEHSTETVRLYLQESFTFQVHAAEAAVPLRYPERAREAPSSRKR
jgi:uncharacterized linocin/CFP29 family protein